MFDEIKLILLLNAFFEIPINSKIDNTPKTIKEKNSHIITFINISLTNF